MDNHNSDDNIKLRHMRDNLVHAGYGYIIFGIWSVLKLFMMSTMQKEYSGLLSDSIGSSTGDYFLAIAITAAAYLVMIVFTLGIHLWIGYGAVRYGRGTGRKKSYVVMSAIGIIITLALLPFYFWNPSSGEALIPDDTTIASVLVDITLVFVFLDMILSTVGIDRLTKSSGQDISAETAD
ncbi:MAG: hypothetical protein K5673_05695 [Lachnospiraceae bacterium]|nr:hypothetical protein [Lachnospiraceae bacterium]